MYMRAVSVAGRLASVVFRRYSLEEQVPHLLLMGPDGIATQEEYPVKHNVCGDYFISVGVSAGDHAVRFSYGRSSSTCTLHSSERRGEIDTRNGRRRYNRFDFMAPEGSHVRTTCLKMVLSLFSQYVHLPKLVTQHERRAN